MLGLFPRDARRPLRESNMPITSPCCLSTVRCGYAARPLSVYAPLGQGSARLAGACGSNYIVSHLMNQETAQERGSLEGNGPLGGSGRTQARRQLPVSASSWDQGPRMVSSGSKT